MGFPMTVERVIQRNRLDRSNYNLMDDLRRLSEDSVTLVNTALEGRIEKLPRQMQHADPFFIETYDYETVSLKAVLDLLGGREERSEHHSDCCGACDTCLSACWGYHGRERRSGKDRRNW